MGNNCQRVKVGELKEGDRFTLALDPHNPYPPLPSKSVIFILVSILKGARNHAVSQRGTTVYFLKTRIVRRPVGIDKTEKIVLDSSIASKRFTKEGVQ